MRPRHLTLLAAILLIMCWPGQPAFGGIWAEADDTGGVVGVGDGGGSGGGSAGSSPYSSCVFRTIDNTWDNAGALLLGGSVEPFYDGGEGTATCVRRSDGSTAFFLISPRDAAALVADMAVSQLVLPTPDVATSPPRGGLTLVGVPVWFWTTNTAPVSTTATIPGLSATLTATLDSTTVTVDDTTTTCHHGGTPYDPTHPNATGSGGLACAHTFQTHGARTATITTRWRLTWTATNGQSGTLVDRTRPTTVTLNPHQAQATTD